MINAYIIGLSNSYPPTLEQMHKVVGTITEIHTGKTDWIKIKELDGNEDKYEFIVPSSLFTPKFDKYKNNKEVFMFTNGEVEALNMLKQQKTHITVWCTAPWFLHSYKFIRQMTINGMFVGFKDQYHNRYLIYDHVEKVKEYEEFLPNIFWWLEYSLFGWLWVWWLNKKELPIHRLNKMKFYKKNRLKDK